MYYHKKIHVTTLDKDAFSVKRLVVPWFQVALLAFENQ